MSPATTSPPHPRRLPDPADLTEPAVIDGDAPTPEEVHHEPKAASRDSAHGGGPGDREEAGHYREEIADTTDAEDAVPTGDAQLADDEPLIEPGAGAAARNEEERMARAADPRPE